MPRSSSPSPPPGSVVPPTTSESFVLAISPPQATTRRGFARGTMPLPPLPHLAPDSIRVASCAAVGIGGPRGTLTLPNNSHNRTGDWRDDSITLLASVKDMDDDDDDVNDDCGGLWLGGQRDPVVVVIVVFVDDDTYNVDDSSLTASSSLASALLLASFLRRVIVVVVAGPHSLYCCHRPCLRLCGSHCCCHQCRHCSPPLMVGCCVAYSFVCHPLCHLPLSSLCDHQHFRRRPPSPIADLCQPLFYRSCPGHPSPLPIPSMVGCCVLRPPSSIPTELPIRKRFHVPTFGLIFDLLRVRTRLFYL